MSTVQKWGNSLAICIPRALGPQVFNTMPQESKGENGTDFMVAFVSGVHPVDVPYQSIWTHEETTAQVSPVATGMD